MKSLKRIDSMAMNSWLAAMSDSGREVFVPAMNQGGAGVWRRFDMQRGLDMRKGVTTRSIKEFLFPQPEVLLKFSRRRSDPDALLMKEPDHDRKETVVAGVRPCDARSVVLNSMPYAEDPYFATKREQLLLVGFLCSEPCSTCFCVDTGGSPMGTEGMDVSVTPHPDGHFLVEPVTEKGESILELLDAPDDISETEERWLEAERNRWSEKAEETGKFVDVLVSADLMALYNADHWQEIADVCINCGTCTFLCPTCYCFDIQDENVGATGRRIRYWDSCMFPLFTKHASGHNPRGEKIERCRNRFMHKLRYFPERFKGFSCVGCGRCVRLCPVNIDIREVMKQMLSVAGRDGESLVRGKNI